MKGLQYPEAISCVHDLYTFPFDDQMPRRLFKKRRSWKISDVQLRLWGHIGIDGAIMCLIEGIRFPDGEMPFMCVDRKSGPPYQALDSTEEIEVSRK